jgi:hypothetical protein
MGHKIASGTALIREASVLPDQLRLECEPCKHGWTVVTNFDIRGLDREIQKAGWTFFCVAGETRATVFGVDPQKTLRRAIERIIERDSATRFNALEITRVASAGSERFPLVLYVTVWAQWRHIQQGLIAFQADKVSKSSLWQDDIHKGSAAAAIGPTAQFFIA